MILKVSRGDLKGTSRHSAFNEDGDTVAVGKSSGPNIDHLNGDLAFLPSAPTADKPYSKRGQWAGNLQSGPEGAAEARVIKADRSEALAKVQEQLGKAFDTFFQDVYRDIDEGGIRSEEHTSELQSLMRISYAVFGLQKKITTN